MNDDTSIKSIELVDARQYPIHLAKECHSAKKRIVIAAMFVFLDDSTTPLFEALHAALARGVSVEIIYDAYTKYILAPASAHRGNLLRARQQIKDTSAEMERLRSHGAHVTMLGSSRKNPYKDVFHQKFTIIDAIVYFAGGCNFSGDSFQNIDYMLKTHNAELAEQLIQQIPRKHHNSSWRIDTRTTLLLDGGAPGTSLIYQKAEALATDAETIMFVSQLCPSGELTTILRGKNALCYFNRPTRMSGPAVASQIVDQARYRIRNSYHHNRFIHAKYMLFTMPDGSKKLLSGSHNFSLRGVTYGTRELAIESTNKALWYQLEKFTKTYIM